MGRAWPALDIHVPGCDPQLQELVLAELDDFDPTAIQEGEESSPLRAFFTSAESRDAAARALAEAFRSHLFVAAVDVEDEDWAARSQALLRAITIGRLVIAPPWDVPAVKRGRVHFSEDPGEKCTRPPFTDPIIIKPSMGFGTGHHATTRLMLSALQELPIQDRTVLDVGCGSGVLAIAAAALGARSTVGIDVDPDALANAAENIQLNNRGAQVQLLEGDFRHTASHAQVVLANLTGGQLEHSSTRLADLVEPQGHLLVSGFMESEKESVVAPLEKFLTLKSIDQEDEWMCAVFYKSRQM